LQSAARNVVSLLSRASCRHVSRRLCWAVWCVGVAVSGAIAPDRFIASATPRCLGKADEYDSASNRGISKKLLKTKIKERELKAKTAELTKDLQEDERSEYQMLSEKLGEFADTPLGQAAMAAAKPGESTLRSVGL